MRVWGEPKEVWSVVRDFALDALFPLRVGLCHRETNGGVQPGCAVRVDCLDGSSWRCVVQEFDEQRCCLSWAESQLGQEQAPAGDRVYGLTVAGVGDSRDQTDVDFSCTVAGEEGRFLRWNVVLGLAGTSTAKRRISPLSGAETVPLPVHGATPTSLCSSPAISPENARDGLHEAVQAMAARAVAAGALGREEDNPEKMRDPPQLPGAEATAQVLDTATNTFASKLWADVRPGDIVQLESGDHCPADAILLWSTSPLETGLQSSGVSGRTSALLRRVAPLPREETGEADAASALALLGTGDPDAVGAVARLGTFVLPPPRTCTRLWKARFVSRSGDHAADLDHHQLVARHGRLVMTERALVLVAYTGADTLVQLHGGEALRQTRHVLREREAELKKRKEKAEKEERERSRGQPADPAQLVRETGIEWEDRFVDVPDDGNCLPHAFWLGLKTLLERRPDLRLADEPALGDDPVAFRSIALESMRRLEAYRSAVASQLQLFLSLDPMELFSVEDFFMMPEALQTKIAELNQLAQLGGFDQIDFPALLDEYVDAIAQPSAYVEGQPRFVPLGALELEFLLQIYKVRLHTIKSEALDAMRKWREKHVGEEAAKGEVDPRTIDPRHVHDQSCAEGSSRVVRVLNVNSNHYRVHLPAVSTR